MMDYTRQATSFKLAKAFRYLRLFGPSKTLAKIRGQYHMKRQVEKRPESTRKLSGHVGLIGCGNFAYSVIAHTLRKNYGNVIRGCMDIDPHRAASLAMDYRVGYHTCDATAILEDDEIDLIFIASNHASHSDYAVAALRAGKAVHIEKPHCVSRDGLEALCQAMTETDGKVSLGFNRAASRMGRLIAGHLAEQPGPAMMNWFVAGHAISENHWYFQPEEGGRVLGNLCHWTDFLLQMIPAEGRFPIRINPTRSGGTDCDIAVTFAFADGSVGTIAFSAKGHVFEGVRERFSAQKGNAVVSLDDFQRLIIEVVEKKYNYSTLFRDHGHVQKICEAYEMVRGDAAGASLSYVWETGQLFLATKEALERMSETTVRGFADS